jgi:hypothetical protein
MSQDSNTPVEAGQVGRTAHTSRARKAWVAPKVLTAQLRDTSSSHRSIVSADRSAPGIYYNPS